MMFMGLWCPSTIGALHPRWGDRAGCRGLRIIWCVHDRHSCGQGLHWSQPSPCLPASSHLENVTDYNTNFAFVQHVHVHGYDLSRSPRSGTARLALLRCITSAYAADHCRRKAATAVLCWIGAMSLLAVQIRADAAVVQSSKDLCRPRDLASGSCSGRSDLCPSGASGLGCGSRSNGTGFPAHSDAW